MPPPPSPPPPSPPPLAPDTAYAMVVSTTLAIAGSVETFNQTALQSGLASIFGLSPDAIILTLRAGSILVDVRLQVSDLPTARQIFDLLAQPTAADTLSEALGLPIQRATTPEIVVITTNTTLTEAVEIDKVLIASLSVPLGLLACLALATVLVRRRRRRRRVDVDYALSPDRHHLDANELSRAYANRMFAEQYGWHQRMPPPHETCAPGGMVPLESGSMHAIYDAHGRMNGTISPGAVQDTMADSHSTSDGALQHGSGGLSKSGFDQQLSPHARLEAMRVLQQSLTEGLFAGVVQPPSYRSAPKRTAVRTAKSEGALHRHPPSLSDAPSSSNSPVGAAGSCETTDGPLLAVPPVLEEPKSAGEEATPLPQQAQPLPRVDAENHLVTLLRQQSETFDKERLARSQEYGTMQESYERRIRSLLEDNERQRHLLLQQQQQHSRNVLPQHDAHEGGSTLSESLSLRQLEYRTAYTPSEESDAAHREAMANKIAAHARGYAARRELHQARRSATTIGAHARGGAARKELYQARNSATAIGAHARGGAARRELCRARNSASTIGAHARGSTARKDLHQARSNATTISAHARGYAARHCLQRAQHSATTIGAIARGSAVRRELQYARDTATLISARVRGNIARREFDAMRHAQQQSAASTRAKPTFPQTLRMFF